MSSAAPPSRLLSCPTEILIAIGRHLPNRDVKSLRLSCTRLKSVSQLRLDRIFLSANPRNVAVFNAVAADEVFRHQVTEIVWDDALLVEDATQDRDTWLLNSDDEFHYYGEEDDDATWGADEDKVRRYPRWFGRECDESLLNTISADMIRFEMADWTKHPMLPITECWTHYRELFRQQREVLQSGAHVRALEDAWRLRRFPNVRTITITPAAHGRLFYPLFETPMIRAFPPGFNYCIPRGWPVLTDDEQVEAEAWDDEGNDCPGFRAVTSIVAAYPHELAELRVDSFQIATGLTACVFEEPCRALADFTTIVTRPSFQHLHLDLLVGGQENQGWSAFTSGHLARVLSAAKLQSLSIRTDVAGGLIKDGRESPVPLRTILPPASLSCVRHFRLAGFYVDTDDLIHTLADLPIDSLETVELSFLWFCQDPPPVPQHTTNTNHHRYLTSPEMRNGFFGHIINQLYPSEPVDANNNNNETNSVDTRRPPENMGHLLERIRDELSWRHVQLTIGERTEGGGMDGRACWASADDFLYRGGENPCRPHEHYDGRSIAHGFGTEKDVFDASHERPYVASGEGEALGYRYWYDELQAFQCRP
ncbi:hypothetical protein PG996_002914 [Apiospora saccharicola]|uniref:F-box domain-containing protein n=1 Tax=Apiospora saccharicola TaxID=335842 RepID=A0ABR1WKV7_9PEZI